MDAVIGGTQLTSLPNMQDVRQEHVTTPFGAPSGPVSIGTCGGREIAFLPRHGNPHTLAPHKINYRANIWALKQVGASNIVAIATSGGIYPSFDAGLLVIPDQVIDYTYERESTYYDGTNGEPVRHIDFTEPFTQSLRMRLLDAARVRAEEVHDGGCYGCFNGPRLETAAEIRRLQRDGCDLVGQTIMPEAALARELDIGYAAICPIVNPAAGLGENKHAINREGLARSRQASFDRVVRILSQFVSTT